MTVRHLRTGAARRGKKAVAVSPISETGLSHWTPAQSERLRECIAQGHTIAYWCSNKHGKPANHSGKVRWTAEPGLVVTVEGPLELGTARALHGTDLPHFWNGNRIWVVALCGELQTQYSGMPGREGRALKYAALEREILGEVLPHEAWDASVGITLGRRDLCLETFVWLTFLDRDLTDVDFRHANLLHSEFRFCDLKRANFSRAACMEVGFERCHADDSAFVGANLFHGSFQKTSLSGASFVGASLSHTVFERCDLKNAQFECADLTEATIVECDIEGATFGNNKLNGCDFRLCNGTPAVPPEGPGLIEPKMRMYRWRSLDAG